MTNIIKHKYLYAFLIILVLIGTISGYIYYSVQPDTVKETAINSINIKEELSVPVNNIPKRIKSSIIILFYSFLIIFQVLNIFEIFYKPFQIGFIFNLLKTYNLKFSILYNLIYQIIPFLLTLILIRVSISISYNLISVLLLKDKKRKKRIIVLLKKYLILSIILLLYEFIIMIFSSNINAYLMAIL